jgi:hypothetical protein
MSQINGSQALPPDIAAQVATQRVPLPVGACDGSASADGAVDAGGPLRAQLRIHAHGDTRVRGGALGWVLQWIPALVSLTAGLLRRPVTRLEIDDLQGRRFFAAKDARSLIDVPLPAGTYHVTARLGSVHRCYTVKLEQGAHVDLYLRLASDRP